MGETTSSPWWRSDASVVAVLAAFAVVAFTATYFVSKSFSRTQDALARYWMRQGESSLRTGNPAKAVSDYRTALVYSHENPAYRLRLAQALAADKQTPQAIAYFLNLWEQQPGNGLYNLELARLYSREGDERKAARFYNGAVYGAWDSDPATARHNVRIEFIRFLLDHGARAQAQAEAIILSTSVAATDIPGRFEAAGILLNTGEYDRAIAEYSSLMRNDGAEAAFGAGQAAFEAGRFQSAVRYLNTAVGRGTKNSQAKQMLQQARMVLDADPTRRRISSAERAKRVLDAFQTAGKRIESCAAARKQSLDVEIPQTDLQKLYEEWNASEPSVQLRKLRTDDDLRDYVMEFVDRVETITAQQCGMPTGKDWALLMLARHGEGVGH